MSTLNKQLQERIGGLIGKDYFKLEKGQKIKVKDLGGWEFSDFWINNKAPIHFESSGYYIVRHGMTWSGFESEKKCIYQYSNGKKEENKDIEIIGTEPTLNDLLMALNKNNSSEFIDFCENLWRTNLKELIDCNAYPELTHYDLSLSLFNQTDETKLAVLKLLK